MNSSSMLCCGGDENDDVAASNWSSLPPNTTTSLGNDVIVRVLNVTNQSPIRYALPLYGYVMPLLLVVTIVANTLIVVVLSKRHMRTPTNLVLMAMALSDMLTLLFPAPWLFYMYTLGNHYKPLFPLPACYGYMYMQEVLPNLFHTASIWLTLALAVQRYVYVCLPPMARTWCTVPRVKRAVGWIYALAALHQSTRFVDTLYSEAEVEWRGSTASVCVARLAHWVERGLTVDVYFNIYFWFRIIFVHVAPCTLLVLLNLLLFDALRRAQRKRQRLFFKDKASVTCHHDSKLRDSNCTTLMLIVVVTVFLAVEIPLAVITVLHTVQSTFGKQLLDYDVANVLILFTNFFIMLSYPINFAIYCGMSRQFRETFKELFISGVGVGVADVNATGSRRDGAGSARYSLASTAAAAANGPARTNETVL